MLRDPICCCWPDGRPCLLVEETTSGGVVYLNGSKQTIDRVALNRLQRTSAFNRLAEIKEPQRKARKQCEEVWETHWLDLLRRRPKQLWLMAEELGVDPSAADELWLELMGTEPPAPPKAKPKRIPPTQRSVEHQRQQAQRVEEHRARPQRIQAERQQAKATRPAKAKSRRVQELEAAIDEQLALVWQQPAEPVAQAAVDQLQHRRAELNQIYRLKGWRIAA